MIEVGKEYIVGHIYNGVLAPTNCNSEYNGHPCRIHVLSVGRKYATAMMTGSSKPQKILLEALHEIDTAKTLYRKALEDRDAMWLSKGETCMLGQEYIDELVETL